MKIENNKFYKLWFKDAWPYMTGAILLSLFQIVTFATTGNPWGVSAVFANWGALIFEAFGGSVDQWYYFSSPSAQAALDRGLLDGGSLRNMGIIVGALFATLMASQFKFKKIKAPRQIVAAVIGGLIMGYGARLSAGCNIGALYSGIASLSLSGWVFALFMFFGAVVGSKLLVKYFM